MPRDPRIEKLQRLRTERVTRAAGSYYGTRATVHGNVPSGPRKRGAGRTLLSLFVFVAILAVAVIAGGEWLVKGFRPPTAQQARAVTVVIKPNESANDLSDQLQKSGLVANATLFHWYLRLTGTGSNIQAGSHKLNTGMSMEEVVNALSTPPPARPSVMIRIPEGWRAEQIAAALDQNGVASYASVMTEIKQGSFSYSFLSDRPVGASLEGYLMPDTYQFFLHEGAHTAIDRLLSNFNNQVSTKLISEGKTVYGSFYKAVTLASIVEREAGTDHDRALIASVYLNRLHDTSGGFTLLNADPTVQYAVGSSADWWKATLTKDDLAVDSPYNTYLHAGLPPGPIAEPSLASIQATVEPASTTYFYFYHINGSEGKSIFCTAAQGSQCAGTPQ